MDKWPLGVFASLDAGLGVNLDVAHELGVPTIQLHAPRKRTRTPDNARRFIDRVASLGIRLTAVFGGFEGESYADIPTVMRTVGLMPPATRAARFDEMREISDFARTLEVDVVALHLGFVPHDRGAPSYIDAVVVTRQLCEHCRGNRQALHLETGQERADTLLQFLRDVDRDNLFVNFDPANMILYGSGEPIAALELVGRYVRSVHCKDATWAARPGQEWGVEVALGEGAVNFERFLRTLDTIGYTGPLTIEREIPQEPARQKIEIGRAMRLLEDLKSRIARIRE
jgi:sugar phosphate isomerase/epimerase